MENKVANYLRSLGLTWINIAEAMSDENREKTIQLVMNNPKITKEEFLQEMQIEEFRY